VRRISEQNWVDLFALTGGPPLVKREKLRIGLLTPGFNENAGSAENETVLRRKPVKWRFWLLPPALLFFAVVVVDVLGAKDSAFRRSYQPFFTIRVVG
jgi:hypothetical protein